METEGNQCVANKSVPRASGDGPAGKAPMPKKALCSPRERGWPGPQRPCSGLLQVFPARAGMARRKCWRKT